MAVPLWAAVAVVVITAVAADQDLRTRRIPNRLTAPALLLALVAHGVVGGRTGLTQGLLGALVAGGVLVPGWLLGWTGAGDVKLMAAVGAWLAFPASLAATLASLMAGGVFSLIYAVRHRALGRVLRNTIRIGAWAAHAPGLPPGPPATSGLRFPFATAIFVGSLISLWWRL